MFGIGSLLVKQAQYRCLSVYDCCTCRPKLDHFHIPAAAAAAVAAPTVEQAIARAADLLRPGGLDSLLQQAVAQGHLPKDGSVLSELLKALEVSAAAGGGGGGGGGGGAAAVGGGAAVASAVQAASELLGGTEVQAAAVVVKNPKYLQLLSGGLGEARERAGALAKVLGVDQAEVKEVVRSNPVLLLVPPELLRRKLQAMSNMTGLSMQGAAEMVTLFMFPGV